MRELTLIAGEQLPKPADITAALFDAGDERGAVLELCRLRIPRRMRAAAPPGQLPTKLLGDSGAYFGDFGQVGRYWFQPGEA